MKYLIVSVLLFSSVESMACSFSPRGFAQMSINKALEKIPHFNTILSVEIGGGLVLVKNVDSQTSSCSVQGFTIRNTDGMCGYEAVADNVVRECK